MKWNNQKSKKDFLPPFHKSGKGGLTVIEIVIVIAIFIFIIGFGLVANLSFLKRDLISAERAVVVSSLEKTRSRSMANLFGSPHGFCYISPNYIIFRDEPGTRCVAGASTNEVISANINISENASSTFPSMIIFSQLAGTTTDETIRLSDGVNSVDIKTNYEGRIEW